MSEQTKEYSFAIRLFGLLSLLVSVMVYELPFLLSRRMIDFHYYSKSGPIQPFPVLASLFYSVVKNGSALIAIERNYLGLLLIPATWILYWFILRLLHYLGLGKRGFKKPSICTIALTIQLMLCMLILVLTQFILCGPVHYGIGYISKYPRIERGWLR